MAQHSYSLTTTLCIAKLLLELVTKQCSSHIRHGSNHFILTIVHLLMQQNAMLLQIILAMQSPIKQKVKHLIRTNGTLYIKNYMQ